MKLAPVGREVTRLFLEQEVSSSNLGPVMLDTVLPTARHRCDITSKEAVLPAAAMTWRWAPPTHYMLRRNTASMMKDLIGFTIILLRCTVCTAFRQRQFIKLANINCDYFNNC